MTEEQRIGRIAFLGDVHLGSQKPAIGAQLAALLARCHHVVANLESPLCPHSPIDSTKILLRSEPGLDCRLADWRVTVATLANNHVFDHGVDGFLATCRALNRRNILFLGAGQDIREAARPLVLDCGPVRVGLIACAEPVTQARMATAATPGCNPLELTSLAEQVHELRTQADAVIVLPHWGLCDYNYPPLDVVACGEQLLDAGADVVIGHHSHVVQGVRRRERGGTIVYSLGDFFFDSYRAGRSTIIPSAQNRKGLVVIAEVVPERPPRILPVFTRHCGSVIDVDGCPQREKELADRGIPLVNLDRYPAYWHRVVRRRLLRRIGVWIRPWHWRRLRLATLKGAVIMGRQLLLRRVSRTRSARERAPMIAR